MPLTLLLCAALCVGSVPVAAQKPKPKAAAPQPKPAAPRPAPTGTLVISCDDACDLDLDGDSMGRLAKGQVRRFTVPPGAHILSARTSDGREWSGTATVETGRQAAVVIALSAPAKADSAVAAPRGSLLISVDAAADVTIDGESVGGVQPGLPKTVPVSLGKHIVAARTKDGITAEAIAEVKSPAQEIVTFALIERAARIASERLDWYVGVWECKPQARHVDETYKPPDGSSLQFSSVSRLTLQRAASPSGTLTADRVTASIQAFFNNLGELLKPNGAWLQNNPRAMYWPDELFLLTQSASGGPFEGQKRLDAQSTLKYAVSVVRQGDLLGYDQRIMPNGSPWPETCTRTSGFDVRERALQLYTSPR